MTSLDLQDSDLLDAIWTQPGTNGQGWNRIRATPRALPVAALRPTVAQIVCSEGGSCSIRAARQSTSIALAELDDLRKRVPQEVASIVGGEHSYGNPSRRSLNLV
jgi:hypothetical protein